MSFIDNILNVFYGVVGVVFVYIIIILAAILVYLFVVRKKKGKGEDEAKSHVSYSRIKREDACDYLKFDTIADLGGMGAIVSRDHKRFVAGIALSGFDFRMASAEDRYMTMLNMISVTNNFESLQIRQESRPILLTDSINDELEIISKLEDELDRLEIEAARLTNEAQAIFDRAEATGEESDADKRVLMHYYDQLVDNQQEQECVSWMIDERREIVNQYRLHSGDAIDPERFTVYFVEWNYTVAEHASRELTNAEIYQEARRKLLGKLEPISNALSRCSVGTHVMSAEEMVDTVRHHFLPYSSTKMRVDEVLNSSYTHLFTTADTFNVENEYEQEMAAEEAYEDYVSAVNEAMGITDETDESSDDDLSYDEEPEVLETDGFPVV